LLVLVLAALILTGGRIPAGSWIYAAVTLYVYLLQVLLNRRIAGTSEK
jgi:hypothetical protein